MKPTVINILAIYAIFALAMLLVIWPMLRAASLAERRDESEREGRIKQL